jgi:cyclopropane fatty-acyl-phospholipid synthase-like methyltransferase
MKIFRKLFFQIFYLRKPPWDTNQTPPEVFAFMESNPPGRSLDLGCGTGTNAITLAQHGWEATGVDFVPKAIRSGRRKARAAGVEVDLRVGDVTRLEGIEGPFDLILDIGCYQSLQPSGMEAYREQVKRLIAPGGTYLIYLFFRPEGNGSRLVGSSVIEADLAPFSDFLALEKREDGSERGLFKSAWLTYRKE